VMWEEQRECICRYCLHMQRAGKFVQLHYSVAHDIYILACRYQMHVDTRLSCENHDAPGTFSILSTTDRAMDFGEAGCT
jgi:hypothetical protein